MEPLIQHQNRTVRVDQVRVTENALARTYLTADESAAETALSVKDTAGFATGKYIWINPYGVNSEIVAVHSSTDPASGVITAAAGTAFAHAAGEQVFYVEFNQIEISHADTADGTKTVLATQPLFARSKEFVYLDTAETDGFYFARFKDSVADTFGSYSDGVDYDGWAENTVGFMIEAAMRDLSLDFSNKITPRDCFRWINKGLREVKGKVRKWNEHYVYNYITDQAQRGQNVATMPPTIYDTETNRSIDAVRIGDDAGLVYLDPGVFDAQQDDVRQTTVLTAASAADTTLALGNSYDFDDIGSVSFYIAGTKHTISYTGVTLSDSEGATAALTGIPASGEGSITVTVPVGTTIWQNESEGKPYFYTVRNSQIEYWPLPDAANDNQNVYVDFNTAATEVDSESDVIDYLRYDIIAHYLTWRLWCKSEMDGILDKNSGFYNDYREALNDAIRTMRPLKTKTAPNINRMIRRGGLRNKPNPKLLSNDQQ